MARIEIRTWKSWANWTFSNKFSLGSMKITNKNELWFVLAQRTHFIHFFLCIFGTRTKCLIMDLFDDVKQTIYKEMYARGNCLLPGIHSVVVCDCRISILIATVNCFLGSLLWEWLSLHVLVWSLASMLQKFQFHYPCPSCRIFVPTENRLVLFYCV